MYFLHPVGVSHAPSGTSVSLLATLLLIQPRMQFAFVLQGHADSSVSSCPLVYTHDFSVKLLSLHLTMHLYTLGGIVPSKTQDFIFSSAELHEVLISPIFQAVNVCLNSTSAYCPFSPKLVFPAKSLCSILLSRLFCTFKTLHAEAVFFC